MMSHIASSLVDGILTLTLDRPEKLNAFTPQMNNELADAFDAASEDDDVRVIVVTGRGRAFCAGADISGGGDSFGGQSGEMFGGEGGPRAAGRFVESIFRCKKPSIAAINGPAVGVGLTMTLPMDIRLAADDAKLGFVFTRRGLAPEAAAAWFLPKLVGLPHALRWCLTGEMFGAAEALAAGLVSASHPKDELLAHACELARVIADNTAPVATAVTRALLWRGELLDDPGLLLEIDGGINAELSAGPDVAEGVSAFFEKRHAQFPGRASVDMPAVYPWWT